MRVFKYTKPLSLVAEKVPRPRWLGDLAAAKPGLLDRPLRDFELVTAHDAVTGSLGSGAHIVPGLFSTV